MKEQENTPYVFLEIVEEVKTLLSDEENKELDDAIETIGRENIGRAIFKEFTASLEAANYSVDRAKKFASAKKAIFTALVAVWDFI